ncbi:MAG: hypothetical protein CME17_00960 [Gemmatimonadetes bacterium]|nr:hypothetical protein [Gemmatimonadota bacterium]
MARKKASPVVVSTDEIKQSVTDLITKPIEEIKDPDPDPVPGEDPKDAEEWSFMFEHKDVRGKVWSGHFTNKILTLGEQQLVTNTKSRFCGGMPLESIDGGMLALNEAIAHMTFSLQELPSWAEDLRQLRDAAIIFALWEKVRSHETRYFRLDSDTRTAKEK